MLTKESVALIFDRVAREGPFGQYDLITVKGFLLNENNLTEKFDGDRTLLHLAAEIGSEALLAACIDNKNFDKIKDALDIQNRSALHYAALYGNDKILKTLLEKGANQDLVDIYGKYFEDYFHQLNQSTKSLEASPRSISTTPEIEVIEAIGAKKSSTAKTC